MNPGRYIVGTEPASAPVVNPDDPSSATAKGLEPLDPGEVREYEIEIGVLHTPEQISDLEAQMAEIVAAYRASPSDQRIGTTHTGRHGY